VKSILKWDIQAEVLVPPREPKPDPQSVPEAEAEAQEPTEVQRVPQSPSGVPQ
jgi:hypothetical protein